MKNISKTEMLSRRTFAVGATSALASSAFAKPPLSILAQTYIWILHSQLQKKSLAEGIDDMTAQTAAAGFSQVEIMSAFLTPEMAPLTLTAMRKNRLRPTVIYLSGTMHEARQAETTVANAMRLSTIAQAEGTQAFDLSLSPKPNQEAKTEAEMEIEAKVIGEIAKSLQGKGIKTYLHHHEAEMMHGAREWRYLMKALDPALVKCCLDLDWIERGGQSPLGIVSEFSDRIASLHLRSRKNGVWMESLEGGDLDYSKLASLLLKFNYTGHYGVELAYDEKTARTRSLRQNLERSRKLIEKTFAS